jgi:hypothetical protein
LLHDCLRAVILAALPPEENRAGGGLRIRAECDSFGAVRATIALHLFRFDGRNSKAEVSA